MQWREANGKGNDDNFYGLNTYFFLGFEDLDLGFQILPIYGIFN